MNTARYASYTILGIIIILACGITAGIFFARDVDRTQRQALLEQVHYASLLVTPADIATLTGTESDLASAEYQRLKSGFTSFRSFSPQIRFVYLMGYNSQLRTQFFYFDSEPTDSSDYSPPGQIFPDTRQSDIDHYLSGIPYTDGPYRDSWGEWISAYKPIIGEDGVVGMVGVDIATDVWHKQIAFAYATTGIITALLGILFLILMRNIRRKQDSIEILTTENRTLQHRENELEKIQSLARLGKIVMYFPERTIKVDDQFGPIFGKTDQPLSLNEFLAYVHTDDQQKLLTALDEIAKTDIAYSWVDVRIGATDQGYRMYHIYGNIDRGDSIKFSGIMQDITDIEN